VVFCGVDAASEFLDIEGLGSHERVLNEPRQVKEWVKSTPRDAVIAVESTGGYWRLLADLAYKSGRTVYLLSPRQVWAYRHSLGRRAKNDKMDARLIRDFIQSNHARLHPYEPWAEPWKTLRDTVRLRTRLARDRARIALRMRAFGMPPREIAKVTRGIKDQLIKLDKQIKAVIEELPEAKAVQSIKGIGPLTTAALIAVLKQIPLAHAAAFVAYIGLDLVICDSGKRTGKRRITSWGDVTLRSLFYLAGKSAARAPEWQPYVNKLKQRGMKPIQIHCALARRLARIAFALYHSGETFDLERFTKDHTQKEENAPSMLAMQT